MILHKNAWESKQKSEPPQQKTNWKLSRQTEPPDVAVNLANTTGIRNQLFWGKL